MLYKLTIQVEQTKHSARKINMDKFKVALRAFIRNELTFDTLTQKLEQVLEQTPAHSAELRSILSGLHKANKLSAEVYATLISRIEQFNDVTQIATSSNPKQFSETDSNRTPLHQPEQWEDSNENILRAGVIIRENYRLEQILGKGGMGIVWKALDLILYEGKARDPYVAIKFLNTDFKQHPDALTALVREFARYKRLSHPNIVEAYELSRTGKTVFMVMELVKGISLKTFIQSNPNGISLQEAEPFIRGMGNALAYAHQKGIVHLDFKPGNVFYDEKEKILKVIDFGIARLIDPYEREETRYDPGDLGALTESYASYEMLAGAEPDARDDIYALACVTYQLLCGKHPFNKEKATKAKVEKYSPKSIKSLNRKQNQALCHGLAFERKNRTPTVDDFLTELFRKSVFWF